MVLMSSMFAAYDDAVFGSYERKILTSLSGIVGYWPLTPSRFANGANGVQDVSANGLHGTNTNAVKDAADGPSAGMGRAASFGGNAVIAVANVPRNTAGTAAIWAKQTPLTGSFDTMLYTQRAYLQRRNSGADVYFAVYSANSNSGAIADTNAASWCCYITTWTSGAWAAYVNARRVYSTSSWTPSALGAATMFIGDEAGTPGVAAFGGYLMHCLLLDHAASDTELSIIRNPS